MSAPEHDPLCKWLKPCHTMHGGVTLAEHSPGTIGGETPRPPYCSNCAVWCNCPDLRAARADERERAAERVAALTLRYAMEPGHVALATAAIRTP